jgi:hypothetical protein
VRYRRAPGWPPRPLGKLADGQFLVQHHPVYGKRPGWEIATIASCIVGPPGQASFFCNSSQAGPRMGATSWQDPTERHRLTKSQFGAHRPLCQPLVVRMARVRNWARQNQGYCAA